MAMSDPTTRIPGDPKTPPWKRPARAKAASKAASKKPEHKLSDVRKWISQDEQGVEDEVMLEAEDGIDGEELLNASQQTDESEPGTTTKRRVRGKKVSVAAGYSLSGEPLPTDNSAPYTAQQWHVVNKTLKTGGFTEEQKKALTDKGTNRNMKCCLINSLVDPKATYAVSLNTADTDTWWKKTIKFQYKKVASTVVQGLNETAMIGACGSIENFISGKKKGDIKEGSDGLFYWKSALCTESKSYQEDDQVEQEKNNSSS